MTEIINLKIETIENKVILHLEMDKEKWASTIIPLINSIIRSQGVALPTSTEK